MKDKFKEGLRNYGLTYDVVKEWKYCGGNVGRHLNYFNVCCKDECLPEKSNECVCGDVIDQNLYITDGQNILILGECCIRRYDVPKTTKSCVKCGRKHKSKTYDYCKDCKKLLDKKTKQENERMKIRQEETERIRKEQEQIEAERIRKEQEKEMATKKDHQTRPFQDQSSWNLLSPQQKLETCGINKLRILAKNKKIRISLTSSREDLLERLRNVVDDFDFPIIDETLKIYLNAKPSDDPTERQLRKDLEMKFDGRPNIRLWFTLKGNQNNRKIFSKFSKINL